MAVCRQLQTLAANKSELHVGCAAERLQLRHRSRLSLFGIYFFYSGMFMSRKSLFTVIFLAAYASCGTVHAQFSTTSQEVVNATTPLPPPNDGQLNLELSVGAQKLSAGFGNWNDITLRGVYAMPAHVIQSEISQNRRFGQSGTFVSVGDTYTFNEDWFGSASLGVGDGAFYLPKYRVDASVSRKLLEKRNLVASLGYGYYNAPDGHVDNSVALSAAYYFEVPWVVEAGVRLNRSNPGAIHTTQQFVAATYGRDKQNLVTARYGWGGEGYLATTADTQLVNFKSKEASLSWRHWVNPTTGWLVSANRYENPSYNRRGVNLGLFHSF